MVSEGCRRLGDAQSNLGLVYAKGRGVPRDEVQAYMWFGIISSAGRSIRSK
jgi:TPR repeat protein